MVVVRGVLSVSWVVILAACHQPAPATTFDANGGIDSNSSTVDSALDAVTIADASADSPDAFVNTGQLGMNDISFLLQLPVDPTNTATLAKLTGFADNADLVPHDVFSQVDFSGGDIRNPYGQFHIVALRFDLCDRIAVGPCDVTADGQLRLTFQPLLLTTPTTAADTAVHASYRIPAADLPSVVAELRALARLHGVDPATPLRVNTMLSATATSEYGTRLAALVSTYARSTQLVRLTVMDIPYGIATFQWHASGLEWIDGTFQFFVVPTMPNGPQWMEQDFDAEGTPSTFNVNPFMDVPSGFVTAIDDPGFANGTDADRERALEALATALNPTKTTNHTIQCVGCHISTYLSASRATQAGVDWSSVPGRFTSTQNLSIAAGSSATDNFSVRAFGWRNATPEISQRVANETAMVLDEINARFPM